MKTSTVKLSNIFILFCALLSGLFIVITPPCQSPDEITHFLRAFQVSEGKLKGEVNGPDAGGYLPRILNDAHNAFGFLPYNSKNKITIEGWKQRFKECRYLDSKTLADRTFIDFRNTVLYSPVPYLPQTVGILIGKIFEVNVLSALYIARFVNYIVAIILLYFSFKNLEFSWRRQWILFLIASLPMCAFQIGSANADALTDTLSFFVLSLSFSRKNILRNGTYTQLLVSSFFLGLCKFAYMFIPFTALPAIIWSEEGVWKKKIFRVGLLILVVLLPTLSWQLAVQGLYRPLRSDPYLNPQLQLKFFFEHPFALTSIFFENFKIYREDYIRMAIGVLGWLDTPLRKTNYQIATYLIIIASFVGVSRQWIIEKLSIRFMSVSFLSLIASLFILQLAIYLSSIPVGGLYSVAMQGRYLHPILPLVFFCLPQLIRLKEKQYLFFSLILGLIWTYNTIDALRITIIRYWV